ncbi:unnamed protein product [Sphagnum compactum]
MQMGDKGKPVFKIRQNKMHQKTWIRVQKENSKQAQQVQCSTGFDAVKRRGTQQECPYAVENCKHWELWNTSAAGTQRFSSKFKMLWKIGCC